jgi:hypothetical protein
VKGDENVVEDCATTWVSPVRLADLSSDRKAILLVPNEPPDGTASLKERKKEKRESFLNLKQVLEDPGLLELKGLLCTKRFGRG